MDYRIYLRIIKERLTALKDYMMDAVKFHIHRAFNRKRFNKLRKFKNMYLNERCFLIGNGASLTIEDLEKLKDEKTFAVNAFVLALDEVSYLPTFYGIIDGKAMELYGEEILNSGMKNIFFTKRWDMKDKDYKRLLQIGAYELPQMNTGTWVYYTNMPKNFSKDITKEVYWGYTVVYSMMQVIAYMGFREVFLLGMDCAYKPGQASFKDTRSKKNIEEGRWFAGNKISNNGIVDQYIVAHEAFKEYAEKNGIKVYNATRGGMLEVFPRVDLDSIV